MNTLGRALEKAAKGYAVFPLWGITPNGCRCGDSKCRSPGKHPIPQAAPQGFKNASTDPAAIRRMFRGHEDFANYGIATGVKSGCFALDFDGPDGLKEWEQLKELYPNDPPRDGWQIRTGNGLHVVYQMPPGQNVPSRPKPHFSPNCDVKSDGGYIVGEGSLHHTGIVYTSLNECRRMLPNQWIVDECLAENAIVLWDDDKRASQDAVALAIEIAKSAAPAISGQQGHRTCFNAVLRVHRGCKLSDHQALEVLWEHYNPRCQPGWSEKELQHKIKQSKHRGRLEAGFVLNDKEAVRRIKRGPSAQDLVADLLSELDVFRDLNGDPWALYRTEQTQQILRVGQGSEDWICAQIYERHKKGVSQSLLASTTSTLRGRSLLAPRYDVRLRVSGVEDRVLIDMARPDCQAIEITPDSISVGIPDAPMYRSPGTRELPRPNLEHGSLAHLERYIHTETEGERCLILAWLVNACFPLGPYPVLALHGDEGSGKTTLQRLLQRVLDPNAAAGSILIDDVREIAVAASSRWLLTFDNLSYVSSEVSDFICSVATGVAYSRRRLRTDNDEYVWSFERPVSIASISEVITRADLADRALICHLKTLPEEEMREIGKELTPDLVAKILGGICHAVQGIQRELADEGAIEATGTRMPGFLRRAIALERVQGWPEGIILDALRQNAQAAQAASFENSPVSDAICWLMRDRKKWEGTINELRLALMPFFDDHRFDRHTLPRTNSGYGAAIARARKTLRAHGIHCDRHRTRHTRVWCFERSNVAYLPSVTPNDAEFKGDLLL